ncbi:MAG: hypothetical protein Q4D56_04850 [Bacteroides sp.]|nr:hypothetical protein [Bacteroides sp.]
MKKFKTFFYLFMAMAMTVSFNACSDDDGTSSSEETVTPYHFDLVVTVGRQGGMGRDVTTIVRSVDSLTANQGTISIAGIGCEINSTYTMESIYKGKYYYQVPISADRFTKFRVADNLIDITQEQKFASGYTYTARNYTHAWLDDTTLLIMAANGDKDAIIWTKLNADDMTILGNGTLDIDLADGYDTFTTSGIAAYREADNKLFYFYYNKKKGTTSMNSTNEPYFHVAVIDPETMEVESDEINTQQVSEMAGSAYGELLQSTTFTDESGNLYLAAFNDTDDMEEGCLLRINAGETNFDASYNGFKNTDGKLLTVQYLGNNRVFTYSRNDSEGTKIDSYSHYYSIVNLSTGTRTRLQYNGENIPYSSGRFSQRSAFVDDKVYFGVNPSDTNPCVYIYDVNTGSVEKGAEVEEGYYFEQIRVLED